MLGVVFQDLSLRDRFKQIIKRDVLFNHFLLSMLRNVQDLGAALGLYPAVTTQPQLICDPE